MASLDLEDEERKILADTLESRLSELRMEVSNTGQIDVRDMLKRRKEVLKNVRDKLQAEAAPAGEQSGGRH